ncbi:serine hydrolase [Muricauda sp. MAR_2010_75]|jgi:CubicO group peptidase (beta-lactamase class C family)|uniref:serine hydrolase domain-containing protein n=1 Tax=Allomuricauda sp. MAR_2010_75 TaxID=1250232 RepID=UPI000563892E|nr:serine hydrolase [Muricauda sp. MAR_2010_75]
MGFKTLYKITFLTLLFTVVICLVCCSQDKVTDNPIPNDFENSFLSAHQQNFDTLKLQSLVTKIRNGQFGNVHSLLISRNNQIVLEEYFNGYDKTELHRLFSVTKSFTSALIGIAIDKGFIENLDEKILNYFPEYSTIANLTEEKENMTLEHVLSMSAGYEWDEFSYPYGNPNNSATMLWNSNDMIKYVLDLPLVYDPGTQFTYNSGCSILLSGVIQNKTGKSAEDYAASNLFSKIGIQNWEWTSGANRLTWTSGELYLRSLDMLRFGQLYLNKGNWEGTQVVSENWIKNSTTKKIKNTEYNDYGYHWWVYASEHYVYDNIETQDIYYAIGYGGQFIWIIPHLDLVVVSTAGNGSITRKSEPMLWWDILPSIKGS